MSDSKVLFHSVKLPEHQGGNLLSLPRQRAGWEWMSFTVRRLQPGESFSAKTDHEEAAFVLLGGICQADWGSGKQKIGKRKNVFDGFPHALYLPTGNEAAFTAETDCEIAECRAPSDAKLAPKLVTPRDTVSSLRGGGNASRQIVDVITPAFPADKLMVIEVYTPGGNWSSYPPHKHDVHNPPAEVDLDEIYYYRIRQPEGFALQHLYAGAICRRSNAESPRRRLRPGPQWLSPGSRGSGLRCLLSEFSRRFRSRSRRHRRSRARLDSLHVERHRPAPPAGERITRPGKGWLHEPCLAAGATPKPQNDQTEIPKQAASISESARSAAHYNRLDISP